MQGICSTMMAITMLTTPIFLLVWVVRKLRKRPAGQVKRAALISAACFVAFTALGIAVTDTCEHEYELTESVEAKCEEDGYEKYSCVLCGYEKTEETEAPGHDMVDGVCSRCGYTEAGASEEQNPTEEPEWTEAFVQAGFTEDEIARYRDMVETVGVTELRDVEIIENGIMHIVRGNIYDSPNLQLNVTLENREIIYIELAGIPDVKNVPYINWRGKLKNKKVDTVTSVELYSDTEGGYEGVLVWEDKFIYPCDTDGNILKE